MSYFGQAAMLIDSSAPFWSSQIVAYRTFLLCSDNRCIFAIFLDMAIIFVVTSCQLFRGGELRRNHDNK